MKLIKRKIHTKPTRTTSKGKKTKMKGTPFLPISDLLRKRLCTNFPYTYQTQRHKNNITILEYLIQQHSDIMELLVPNVENETSDFKLLSNEQSKNGIKLSFKFQNEGLLTCNILMKANAIRQYKITCSHSSLENRSKVIEKTISCSLTQKHID